MHMKSLTDYFLKNDLLSIKYLLRGDLLWSYQVMIIFSYFTSLKISVCSFFFFFNKYRYTWASIELENPLWLVLILYTLQTPQPHTFQSFGAI